MPQSKRPPGEAAAGNNRDRLAGRSEDSPGAQDPQASNRLPELAAQIQAAHLAIGVATKTAAERAIEAGHYLIEGKALLAHGQWLPWLREHCRISDRTAQLYMQLARSGMKSATVADLGLAGAAKTLRKKQAPAVTDMAVIIPGTLPDDINAIVSLKEAETAPGFFYISGLIFQRGEVAESFALKKPIRANMVPHAIGVATRKEVTAEQWNAAVDLDLGGQPFDRVIALRAPEVFEIERVDIATKLTELLAAEAAA